MWVSFIHPGICFNLSLGKGSLYLMPSLLITVWILHISGKVLLNSLPKHIKESKLVAEFKTKIKDSGKNDWSCLMCRRWLTKNFNVMWMFCLSIQLPFSQTTIVQYSIRLWLDLWWIIVYTQCAYIVFVSISIYYFLYIFLFRWFLLATRNLQVTLVTRILDLSNFALSRTIYPVPWSNVVAWVDVMSR